MIGNSRQQAVPVQFVLYLAISSIAALVNLFVGFSLYALLGLSAGVLYSLSVSIGYLAGMAVNWSLNRAITFPGSSRRALSELRTFGVVALVGLLLTVALAAALRGTLAPVLADFVGRSGLHVPSADAVAQVMAIGTVAIYSFMAHKWLTFAHGIRFQAWRLARVAMGDRVPHPAAPAGRLFPVDLGVNPATKAMNTRQTARGDA
jgi:putative flippase GtrA